MHTLSPERVESLFASLAADPRQSIRRLAAAAGVTRRTAERYRRIWQRTRVQLAADELGAVVAAALGATSSKELAAEAARRQLTRSALASEILRAVLDDGLVDVVLGADSEVKAIEAAISKRP